MLPSETVAAFKTVVAAAGGRDPGERLDPAVREDARKTVRAAAKELGFDADSVPLPRDGEDPLTTACRTLKLTRSDQAVEEYRRVTDARKKVMRRYKDLVARRHELVRGEQARVEGQIAAGRDPGAVPPKTRDELAGILLELEFVAGNPETVDQWYPYLPDQAVRERTFSADEWVALAFVLHLTRDALVVLTEGENPASASRQYAEHAADPATGYEAVANTRMGVDEALQAHWVAVKVARRVVELADLYRLREREQRREEQERSIDELVAARDRRAGGVKAGR